MAVATDYSGAVGRNFWKEDADLRAALEPRLPSAGRARVLEALDAAGALAGGRLASLIERSHADALLPRLASSDRWGERIDRVEYSSEQVEARRLAMGLGLLPPTPLSERMAKAVLLNYNGEGGITCPLAMTDGLIQLVERHGTEEQKARWLPLARDPGVDTPLTCGQFVTEKQGGSNVSENETSAEPAADGSWRLTGLKWFCSNPGELWVTTAKPAGSQNVALFIMPRRLPGGSLNAAHILRLKDLSATRGKATAEVEYRAAYAEMVGRPARGLALLLGVVLKTSRIHVAAASLGFMGRALLEARLYAEGRVVLGRRVADLPPVKKELEAMARERRRALECYFLMLDAVERGDPAEDVLVPLLKVAVSKLGTEHVRRARLVLAGNGALRDFSPLPRLWEDALIQEIWEGTHPILAG
ncbi:MAG: acyl-CoA dehydrogenase family protein, partial [Elusimicrobia bacterium]|nr:acyl-CoA dehydrogenase family protein [Elusimicrobiota bacterium]